MPRTFRISSFAEGMNSLGISATCCCPIAGTMVLPVVFTCPVPCWCGFLIFYLLLFRFSCPDSGESPLPDFDAIMRTFEPEAIQNGLVKVPELVEDAFRQLQAVLPKFISTLPREQVAKGWSPL